MSDNEEDTFEDTIEWASGGTNTYKRESKGIPLFYLILGAIAIIFLIILLIYLAGRNPDKTNLNALSMMQNNDYVYDIDPGYNDPGYNDIDNIDDNEPVKIN